MKAFYEDDWLTVYHGDALAVLAELPSESVNCVVTSPPYYGLRDYGTASWDGGDPDCDHLAPLAGGYKASTLPRTGNAQRADYPETLVKENRRQQHRVACPCGATRQDAQLGLEPTPDAYIAALVAVFREVRRVLRKDGTVWINLGDSYSGGPSSNYGWTNGSESVRDAETKAARNAAARSGLKPKDRMMIPARVAIALQADGWWLRDEIVWHKPNPMPSSVTDRTTPAHEMVYLLTRSARYWYDADAVREVGAGRTDTGRMTMPDVRLGHGGDWKQDQRPARVKVPGGWDIEPGAHDTIHRTGRTSATYRERNVGGRDDGFTTMPGGEAEWAATGNLTRNKRSVWTVATQPYPEAHFATFPEALIEPMILAGCPDRVCADCGAPWQRVVERTEPSMWEQRKAHDFAGRKSLGDNYKSVSNGRPDNSGVGYRQTTTTGWRATCAHEAGTRPGVVLDPFAGSGTTGVVAQRLSRRAVLIDLSMEYLGQLMDRNRDIPLGLGG